MKYHVTVAGRTWLVEVVGGRVVVDGTAWEAHAAGIPETPLVHLLLGGASWTVAAQALEGPGCWVLGLAGERYEVVVMDERTKEIQALTRGRAVGDGGAVLKAPMPGLIVRVAVSPGQLVAAGDGLVVIEAMKMENELRATRAARVATVHVQPGQAVEKGVELVTLEPVESAEPSG